MSNRQAYDTVSTQGENGLSFLFVSKGKFEIVKVIQFSYFGVYLGYSVYNLGFGDYNLAVDGITDDSNSNNGDVYDVLITVLATIPVFFEAYPTAMLMVQGSDSTPVFEVNCRRTCKRRCNEYCKKYNQRIKIYTSYVNKYFSTLTTDYIFWGGKDVGPKRILENYTVNEHYSAVFVQKR